MPAMRAQASSVYIAIITISASSGPVLVKIMLCIFVYVIKNVICNQICKRTFNSHSILGDDMYSKVSKITYFHQNFSASYTILNSYEPISLIKLDVYIRLLRNHLKDSSQIKRHTEYVHNYIIIKSLIFCSS